MTDMNEVILKADRRGRLRYTAEQKQTFVEAYETSGLSAPQFAALHGVNYQTLVSCLKEAPCIL
jgi:transposase-like protein